MRVAEEPRAPGAAWWPARANRAASDPAHTPRSPLTTPRRAAPPARLPTWLAPAGFAESMQNAKQMAMDKFAEYSQHPQIVQLAEKAKQPPEYVLGGIIGGSTLLFLIICLAVDGLMEVLFELIVFVPAVLKSISIIEEKSAPEVSSDMLSFWLVFYFMALVVDNVLFWVPRYAIIKFVFLQYCFRMDGTATVKTAVVEPLVAKLKASMASPAADEAKPAE